MITQPETDILALLRDLAFQRGLFELRKNRIVQSGKSVAEASLEAARVTWPVAFQGRNAVAMGVSISKSVPLSKRQLRREERIGER